MNNLVCDVKANPKKFYRYINSQKRDAQCIPPLKKRNGGGVAQSESEKAAEFSGQFTDVFTKSEYSQAPLLDRSAPLAICSHCILSICNIYFPFWFKEGDLPFDCCSSCSLLFNYF